jgi:hypothetical protein
MPEHEFRAMVTMKGDLADGDFEMRLWQVGLWPRPPGGERPPDPEPEPWEPPSWLIRDTDPRPMPPTPRPGYLADHTDPTFRSRVTRITGNPGDPIANIPGSTWGDNAHHHYINSQAWNCDQSLIYLEPNRGAGATGVTALYVDGETYVPRLGRVGHPSGADFRWHPSDPDLMDFARLSVFGSWNIRTGATVSLKDFGADYSDMRIGHNKGNRSADGKRVILTAWKAGKQVIIPYNIEDDDVLPDLDPDDVGPAGAFSSAWSSPSGNRIIWNFSPDNYFFTDLAGDIISELPVNYCSHGDCCFDEAGEEVLCGRLNSGAIFPPEQSGGVSKWRLRDGTRTLLTPLNQGGYSIHCSARAQDINGTGRARWVTSGTSGARPPIESEILLMELSGANIYRLCHHHNSDTPDYDANTLPSISPDAGRVIFASVWGEPGTEPRPVGCYVVDYRE